MKPLVSCLFSIVFAASLTACATTSNGPNQTSTATGPGYTAQETAEAIEGWLGVSAEAAASIVERVFSDLGEPNAYIQGGEVSGAAAVGLRYGDGTLLMKNGVSRKVYWRGPSIGFDVGGNASKTFTLVYQLPNDEEIFHRFGGVEGSAYFVGGVGVNYQRYGDIMLAPMRVGVGWRAGANLGYTAYSRERNLIPF